MSGDMTFALKQLRSAWRAGEIRVLLLALVLAVAAMTAVGFFADRIESALGRQGGMLLGGDLVVIADRPIPAAFTAEAQAKRLRTAQTMEFPSMVLLGEEGRLAEIKAVSSTYPLRGKLTIADEPFAPARVAEGVPASGEIWIEPRLASLLGARKGDMLAVGERQLKIAAILQEEPARGGDMFSIAPRLMMNAEDVASTNLIQYGSRIRYRLLLAGDASNLDEYRQWAEPKLERGSRIEDVSGARPEIRNALDKSRQFLGLASMASVILSMVAMSLAGLRFVRRNLDTCALMRCFGASQGRILQIFLVQALVLGLLGSLLGCLLGFAAQEVLAQLAGSLFLEELPPPSWTPAFGGLLAGMAAMLGVMLPHLLSLRGVPALRILRKDLDENATVSWLAWLPGIAVMLGLVFWSARDTKLGWIVLGGLVALLLVACAVAAGAGYLLQRAAATRGGVWRVGIANLLQRPGVGIAQVAGFSLGLMAMALLTIVRGDLLDNWHASLPADAPNRFVINIQPGQMDAMRRFFVQEKLAPPEIFPMVRGRLVAINDRPLDVSQYVEERAKRLAEREWNLSMAAEMQKDNRLLSGRWWTADEHGQTLISLEEGIATTLGIHLGDRLTYDIGGKRIALKVMSLRKVEWDSMRANFFAVAPPGALEKFPASYITSFHLPAGREDVLNRLVRSQPNLTVIDVEAILSQLRGIMDRMTLAIEFVFGFCMLTGIAVLYAALAATQDERVREVAVLRVFGASRRQVRGSVLVEFTGIGFLAGLVATIGASVLAWIISDRLLQIPYFFNPWLALLTVSAGMLLVPAAAWLGVRTIVSTYPRQALQSV
jgi:putative ABC transport system permease protein